MAPLRSDPDPLTAHDLIAERRYAYGKAAADEGDFAVAAELFEQALERAPGWAVAWFALGEAREKLKDPNGAAEAFCKALAADPADAQGAFARLALLGRGEAPSALPAAYVARLFDDYAPRFAAHVTGALSYRGPELILEALRSAAPGRSFASALDVGCGTGLMGEAIRPLAKRLTGVDLSPKMIAKARARDLYDRLEVADAAAFLRAEEPAAFDLIVAADSLVYVGDLRPVFAASAAALAPQGLLAFTVESCPEDGFRLGPTMRFAHARAYVQETAAGAGFFPLRFEKASTRREAGRDAPGLVVVLARR